MNVVIVAHDSQTRKTLQQSLLKEGGFDSIEVFSCAEQAVRKAHWEDTEIILTPPDLYTTLGMNLIRWVHKNHPHIDSITHSLHGNNEIMYSCV